MRSEWVPEPEVESWRGLGARVIEDARYRVGDRIMWTKTVGRVTKGELGRITNVFPDGNVEADTDALSGQRLGTGCEGSCIQPVAEDTDPFDLAVDGILAELRELMLRKHRDYGPLNIALAPGGAINGLRVRMHDKLARINNLTDKQAEPENESLQDSFTDLSNYGIIGLMVLRGLWPGTETK